MKKQTPILWSRDCHIPRSASAGDTVFVARVSDISCAPDDHGRVAVGGSVTVPRHHQSAAGDGSALSPMSLSRIAHVDPILRHNDGRHTATQVGEIYGVDLKWNNEFL
jgi:hypothetical protein